MKKVIKWIALVLVLNAATSHADTSLRERAQSLRHNVVSVNAKMTNTNQQGFAWVIGERDEYLYLVTASHVIEGANPGDELKALTVRFFRDGNTVHTAQVVAGDSKGLDLAVLKIAMPSRAPWLYAAADITAISPQSKVTYIGKAADWHVGEQFGQIERVNIPTNPYDVSAVGLELDVGTSGAPLIGELGIIGLIVTDSSHQTGVISLAEIKDVVTSRSLPWGLRPWVSPPYTLDGVWAARAPNIPDNIRLTFTPSDDTMHYDYTVEFPTSPRSNIGVGVVDGDEVRLWQSMPSAKTSHGAFKIHGPKEGNVTEAIVMDGFITDGDVGPTQVRMVKQNSASDDDRAVAWMKANPSDFNRMFSKYLPAINSQKNGADDDEAFSALGEDEQLTVMGGMAQGMMLRAGLMRLAELGLTNIKLAIDGRCYSATGALTSTSAQQQVDTLLKSLADDATQQFGKHYEPCNLTQVTSAKETKVNSGEFDFSAELAQPKRILSGLAPDATLSVRGDCLLLEGKLPSPVHKMMLANMLQDLAETLSAKSKKALTPCDQTTS